MRTPVLVDGKTADDKAECAQTDFVCTGVGNSREIADITSDLIRSYWLLAAARVLAMIAKELRITGRVDDVGYRLFLLNEAEWLLLERVLA